MDPVSATRPNRTRLMGWAAASTLVAVGLLAAQLKEHLSWGNAPESPAFAILPFCLGFAWVAFATACWTGSTPTAHSPRPGLLVGGPLLGIVVPVVVGLLATAASAHRDWGTFAGSEGVVVADRDLAAGTTLGYSAVDQTGVPKEIAEAPGVLRPDAASSAIGCKLLAPVKSGEVLHREAISCLADPTPCSAPGQAAH